MSRSHVTADAIDVELVAKTSTSGHDIRGTSSTPASPTSASGGFASTSSSSSSSSAYKPSSGHATKKTKREEKEQESSTLDAEIAATGSRTNVNTLFWLRTYRILKIAIGSPMVDPFLYFVMTINLACQIVGAYIIQSLFFYTNSGTWKGDPGLAGCLKSGTCPTSQYKYYLNKFAWQFALVIVLLCIFSVSGDYINTCLRKRLNTYMQSKLLRGHTLYRIQLAGQVDNFDQRVTADTQAMLDGTCSVLFGNTADYLAYPIFFVITRFSCALTNCMRPPNQNNLEPTKSFEVFMVVFALCTVAIIAYVLPMNYISRLFFLGQKFEGAFRAQHAKSVINAEQICLYAGEHVEGVKATKAYDQVFRLQLKYYSWQGLLMFLRLVATSSQSSITYMMLAITDTRDISYANAFLRQSGDVMNFVLWFPAIMARIAFTAGAAHRTGELLEGIEQMEEYTRLQKMTQRQLGVHIEPVGENIDYIELKNIIASPPLPPPLTPPNVSCLSMCRSIESDHHRDRRGDDDDVVGSNDAEAKGMKKALFNNISVRINRGDSLVIMGESGCGKSSLLRVIAGLWPVTSGQVIRPKSIGKDGLFFLPQKAYVFPGSLMEQITYPLPKRDGDIEVQYITSLMHKLDLHHLVEQYNWDTSIDWPSVLSSSERQRLSFARLFFHRPLFCLADEATSCLDIGSETIALDLCKKMNITLISVAHRPSVIGHHKNILQFDKKNRAWDLIEVSDEHRSHEGHEEIDHAATAAASGLPPPPPPKKIAVPQAKEPEPQGMNMLFVRRLLRAISLVCNGWTDSGTYLLLAMFFCMGVYATVTILQFVYLTTDGIVNNVLTGNTGAALNTAGTQLSVVVVGCIAQAVSATCGAVFGMIIQRQIIRQVHKNYYSNNVLYSMNSGTDKLDGIDGRIVSDANQMREALGWIVGNPFCYLNYRIGFFPGLIVFLIMLFYAYSLTWGLTLFLMGILIGSFLVQIWSGGVMSPAMDKRQRAEGILYAHYARIRNSIESITFFEGLNAELATAEVLLENVYQARINYAWRAFATMIPTVVMVYWLTSGLYVMATIIQVWSSTPIDSKVMLNVISFCDKMGRIGYVMVQALGGFGMLSAYTHRIADVQERAAEQVFVNKQIIDKQIHDENKVGLTHTTIIAGGSNSSNSTNLINNAHLLVNDLNFNIIPGTSILVMGASSCGKSMIHRILAGLLDCGSERLRDANVIRPQYTGRDGIFFIPQSNYVTDGSLIEQLIYPHRLNERTMNNEELELILNEVGLSYLINRWTLDAIGIEWSEVLSGGESQRLGMARMLYHRPRFACLDESTSALDLALEADCMNATKKRGITMISIATRLTQKRYHQKLLYLDGNGGWTLTDIANTRQSIIVPEYRAPAAIVDHFILSRRDSAPTQWIDADDPDINEIVVQARSRKVTRKTISMSIPKW